MKEEKDSVEHLKDKLYSRAEKTPVGDEVRTPLPAREIEAPVSWAPPVSEADAPHEQARAPFAQWEEKKHGFSFAAKFLIGAAVFFVLALGAAAFVYFGGGNFISPQNIDIQLVTPSLVDGGKAATFQIIISNRNQSALTLADLILDYPAGTRDPNDPSKALPHERIPLGTIAPGEQVKRTASAVFYGQSGSPQTVTAHLQYSVAGSNAVFEKQASTDFVIGSSPVSIAVDMPSEIIAGQQFAIDLSIQSNAATPLQNVVVQGQYPFGFSVVSATPNMAAGGTLWRLGTLSPGVSEVIHIVGTLDGQDGDERVFRFLAGSNTDETDTQIKVPFLVVPQTTTIRRPFITGDIAINGQTGKTVSIVPGATVQGTVTWRNNLQTSVSNVQLELSLTGPTLDKNSVQTGNGFYQSQNSTITWTSSQDPTLAQVAPGGTGTLQFSFATLPPGAGGTVYTNPAIDLSLTIGGVRQGESGVPEQVTSAASAQVQVASAVALSAGATHFSGVFGNSGPMPPKAESDTSYNIVWTVKNSSNTVANAVVATVLPPYMKFVQGQSGITYDAGTRTVSWTLGELAAGVGYTTPAKTAAFQVILTPSTSQVNNPVALTGDAQLQGTDRFAQVPVTATAKAPTTQLTDDPGYNASMGLVAPK